MYNNIPVVFAFFASMVDTLDANVQYTEGVKTPSHIRSSSPLHLSLIYIFRTCVYVPVSE